MNIRSVSARVCASTAGALLGAQMAHADLSLGVAVGGGYSDNISRVEQNEQDEKIGSVGLNLLWQERTRRLEADASVDLSYFEYLDNTFDSEVVGIADGRVIVGIIPERFTWLFQDSFGQAQSSPFTPVTPATRENLNYFTTGPDFTLNLGSAAALRLFGRFSQTEYETSPLDADRVTAGIALARQSSESRELSLNAVREEVDLKAAGVDDYDRDNVFVNYQLTGSRTVLSADLGYTWIEPEGGDRNGGLLASLIATRELSPSSSIEVEIGSQFTDASDSMRGAIEGGSVGGVDITATSDPFENRTVAARYRFSRNRTGFSVGVSWNEDRYERQVDLDRTRIAYEVSFRRRMARSLDWELAATYNDEEFDTRNFGSDEIDLIARLNWNARRPFGCSLMAERVDRNTSDGTGEFVEYRYFLTFNWRPFGAATLGAP